MRIIFAVSTPHQVHLFRNAFRILEKGSHVPTFIVRDYGCAVELLKHYDFPYRVYSQSFNSLSGKIIELGVSEVRATLIAAEFKADIVVGDALLGYPSKLLGIPSISFLDGDYLNYCTLYRMFSRSDLICTPVGFRANMGKRQLRYPGYQELAYLHPNRFVPDSQALTEQGVRSGERYFVVRFTAFDSTSHDSSYDLPSWESRRNLIEALSKHGRVVISSELPLPSDLSLSQVRIRPHQMHDLLAGADMVVAETAMAVESSLLGVPTVLVHPSVGTPNLPSNFREMESFGLQKNCRTYDEALDAIDDMATQSGKEECQRILKEVLRDKIDVTSFIVWMVNNWESLTVAHPPLDIPFDDFVGRPEGPP